jgi:NAD(P)-dependent dehydrogenase (short-subunit alcohol dehydrogenase family)
MELSGKVALITGASSGMGESTAKILAMDGIHLALVGRNLNRLNAVVEEINTSGGDARPFIADLRFGDQVEKMVNEVVSIFGQIDILINSAFWGPPASVEDTIEDFWDQTLDSTLKSAFLCARAVVPFMRKIGSGRIVNIGSMAGKVGEDNRTAYCAAKWGLEGLNAALAVELSKFNIHVHLISPAATNTPFWREVGAVITPQVIERMIPPEVIGQTIRWVLLQPDQVNIADIPIHNFRNPFEGKGSPFES